MNKVPSSLPHARGVVRHAGLPLIVLSAIALASLPGCKSTRIEYPLPKSLESPFTWIVKTDSIDGDGAPIRQSTSDSLMLPGRRDVAARELASWGPKVDPHNHIPDLTFQPPDSARYAGFMVVLLPGEVKVARNTYAENWHHTVSAFTKYDANGFRLFIENRLAKEFYEVRGIPLPQRPFDDPVWVSDSILAFDRWSTPHAGIHYAIDVRNSVLLQASPFNDSSDASRAPEIRREDMRGENLRGN